MSAGGLNEGGLGGGRAPALGVYGLSFRHGDAKVLDEISFEIAAGEVCALVGPNGSGKSTLLKSAAGVLPLRGAGREGQVRHQGIDFLAMPPRRRARAIAYVGAELRAEFPLSAREAVMLGRIPQGTGLLQIFSPADRDAVRWAMEKCLCWNLRERDLDTLSGGERQLVGIARALAQGARILFLDEALSRMDLNHQALMGRMLKALSAEGFAIIWVAHDLNLASEWADTALLLKAGKRVAYGPLKDVLTQDHLRLLYPGAELKVGASPVTGAPKVFFGKSIPN